MRAGIGYDIHRFEEGRPLILGGIEIAGETGLGGYSDADVLLHAIADALLGAARLADLGTLFSPDDPKWAGADSAKLLAECMSLIRRSKHNYEVENIDATVIAEHPRLGPQKEHMEHRIAEILAIEPERVNLKATTNEGLGAIGRGEGIAAMAIVLLGEATDSQRMGSE
jgi:2-C-methyl-D-erythritol 2,4-cyclodiphosphate synthase